MDDLNRSINEHLKSGQFFLDSHKWYANKFIFPAAERAYLRILLSLFVTSIAILAFFYYQFNPSDEKSYYLTTLPDIASQYSTIKTLGDPDLPPQKNVTEYLLSKYVIARESYHFSTIVDQLNYMRQTSSTAELNNYSNYISINNPSSPIMLYQDSTEKTIVIKNIKLLKSEGQTQQAIVHFLATTTNLMTSKSNTYDLIATISFQIDNIKEALDKKESQLGFLVVNYNISKNNK